MSVINATPLIAAGDDGYQISRSVRLRSSASAYFNRTPASATNRDTWTWSAWLKRGSLSSLQCLFQQGADQNNATSLFFNSTNTLEYNHADAGAIIYVPDSTEIPFPVGTKIGIVVTLDGSRFESP